MTIVFWPKQNFKQICKIIKLFTDGLDENISIGRLKSAFMENKPI